jgi:PEP-CTERM motif
MRCAHGLFLGFLATVGLLCCGAALADPTFDVDAGSACHARCLGAPNLIGIAAMFDIARDSKGGSFALTVEDNGTRQKMNDTRFIEVSPPMLRRVTAPEPGSLALLGTGLLAMAGILRRLFVKP